MEKKKKVILAFSGGLDTSFCVLWLKKQGFEVIALTVDTGGFTKTDKREIEMQAKRLKVSKHYFIDAKKEFYDRIISYIIKGNLLRGGVYPLCAGAERVIIAELLAKYANMEKAEYVAHGSTGAGSDQIRLDVALRVLKPDIKIIAPIRELAITRNQEVKILEENKIPVPQKKGKYSINKSILGTTISGKGIDNPEDYPADLLKTNARGRDEVIVTFSKGLPIEINGKKSDGVEILSKLNKLGSKYGIGKGIHLGNTIIGIKGRIVFDAPGIIILIKAHQELEKLTLTKQQLFWKNILTQTYADFLHEALYFDPVMRDIEALIDSSQKAVSGEVKIIIIGQSLIIASIKSPYSLFLPQIGTYAQENKFWTGIEAAGFAKLYGLQSILAKKAKENGENYES